MPSNLKKRVHERMAKTGESYETALRHVRNEETRDSAPDPAKPPTFAPLKPGQYTGTPKLPPAAPNLYLADGRVLPDDPSRPVIEWLDIQGDYDANDLHRTLVPSTAFDDPTLPEGVKRVLSLGEYLDARAKQTGWTLLEVTPGPVQTFELFGVQMSAMLHVTLRWRR